MKSQRLIESLTPIYDAFCNLCPTGTWTGDIYAIRKALPSARDGSIIIRQLESLQTRGYLTFTYKKLSHKSIIWTVTITQSRSEAMA